jgi:hypothetical protein
VPPAEVTSKVNGMVKKRSRLWEQNLTRETSTPFCA